MPPKKSDDPHFRLRVPAQLKRGIEEAAAANNRSMNAEIVARLEETSDPHRHLARSLALNLATKHDRLARLLGEHEQGVTSKLYNLLWKAETDGVSPDEYLQRAIDQLTSETDRVETLLRERIASESGSMQEVTLYGTKNRPLIESLRDELEELLHERGDLRSEREAMIAQQQEYISLMNDNLQKSGELIMSFRDAFLDASSGDDSALRKIVDSFKGKPIRSSIDEDVRAIIGVINEEIEGQTDGPPLEMKTELGDQLADAIERRVTLAMERVVSRLEETGLLERSERVDGTVVETTNRFGRIAR